MASLERKLWHLFKEITGTAHRNIRTIKFHPEPFFPLLKQEFNKDLLELGCPQNLKKLDPASSIFI